ncbi:MAG: hypothetical protein ACI4JX_00710 [Oscillospiraceae bacterium]
MEGYKRMYQRYCPNMERNVAVEEFTGADGAKTVQCLNKEQCEKENGGCKNTLLCENN